MTTDQATADVIGYTYRADNYCPSCIIDQLPTGPGGTYVRCF